MNWYGNTPNNEWGPSITSVLSAAYEDASQRARELGLDTKNAHVTDAIAESIIAGAKRGVYDRKALADAALAVLRRH